MAAKDENAPGEFGLPLGFRVESLRFRVGIKALWISLRVQSNAASFPGSLIRVCLLNPKPCTLNRGSAESKLNRLHQKVPLPICLDPPHMTTPAEGVGN